jgi:hypothetical protein
MTKPIIGSRYTPTRFETRDSNRTYSARMPGMDQDEEHLQRALLGAPSSSAAFWTVILCSALAAVLLTFAV